MLWSGPGYCGDTGSAMPVTKKYCLLYFESSVLVLGACCCFLVFRRCLLVVHSDPSGHPAQALEALVSSPPQRVSSSPTQQPSLLHESLAAQPVSRPATLCPVQSQQPPAAPATDQPAVLTSPVMDQLMSRVTDEVTKRLQPLLSNLSSMAQQAQCPPSTSSQAPAVSLPVEQSTPLQSSGSNIQQVQGHAAIQDTVEVPAVHDGVQSVLASLSGEQTLLPGTQRPNDVFMSVNLPIDARVPAKIRSKIIQNEFVDFGSLLVNPAFEDKFRITLQPFQEGSSPPLALEPVNKAKRTTSIDVWLQAFHVCVGIFTARYPHEAPDLMKYGATIQDLAARGHNWRYDDENFRFLRQSQVISLPWGTIHWELWLKSQINANKSIPATGVAKNLDVPRGYCLNFHKGGYCSGCSFKHSCAKCDGPHRAINCNFRAFSKGNASNSSNQRSNKTPSSRIIPQPTSTGASSTRKQ